MKVLAFFGEPGVGKSHLVRAILERLGPQTATYVLGPFRGQVHGNVLVLGRYAPGATFPGSDRLPNAALRHLPEFCRAAALQFSGMLLEGWKFCRAECFEAFRQGREARLVVLEDPEARARCRARQARCRDHHIGAAFSVWRRRVLEERAQEFGLERWHPREAHAKLEEWVGFLGTPLQADGLGELPAS